MLVAIAQNALLLLADTIFYLKPLTLHSRYTLHQFIFAFNF